MLRSCPCSVSRGDDAPVLMNVIVSEVLLWASRSTKSVLLLIQQSTITGLLSSEIGDEIIEMRPFLVWMRNGCKRGLHIR